MRLTQSWAGLYRHLVCSDVIAASSLERVMVGPEWSHIPENIPSIVIREGMKSLKEKQIAENNNSSLCIMGLGAHYRLEQAVKAMVS